MKDKRSGHTLVCKKCPLSHTSLQASSYFFKTATHTCIRCHPLGFILWPMSKGCIYQQLSAAFHLLSISKRCTDSCKSNAWISHHNTQYLRLTVQSRHLHPVSRWQVIGCKESQVMAMQVHHWYCPRKPTSTFLRCSRLTSSSLINKLESIFEHATSLFPYHQCLPAGTWLMWVRIGGKTSSFVVMFFHCCNISRQWQSSHLSATRMMHLSRSAMVPADLPQRLQLQILMCILWSLSTSHLEPRHKLIPKKPFCLGHNLRYPFLQEIKLLQRCREILQA